MRSLPLFYRPELAEAVFSNLEASDEVRKYAQQAGFQTKSLLPELPQISVPTLLVVGEDDFTCDPISQGQRTHRAIASSTLVLIPESGYMPCIEQLAAFRRGLRTVVQRALRSVEVP